MLFASDDEAAKATVSSSPPTAACARSTSARWRSQQLEGVGYVNMAIQPGLGTNYGSALKVVA